MKKQTVFHFRKGILTVLTVLCLCLSLGLHATAENLRFDVNGDGVVSIQDVTVLLYKITYGLDGSDINGDGVVSIQDVSMLLTYLSNPDRFPDDPPHTHTQSDWITDKEPTCTEPGSKHIECTACKEILHTASIPAKGHTLATKEGESLAPSCTVDGYTETVTYCTVCHKTLWKTRTVDPALGHDDKVVASLNPTCTADGYLDLVCDRCDRSKREQLPATDHSYGPDDICVYCGKHKPDEDPTHQHHYTAASLTPPSCTGYGYTTFVCACGSSYTGDYLEPTGHRWDEGVITLPKTCEKDGILTYTCTVDGCGATYTDQIPAGHEWAETILQQATCTEDGIKTITCTVCGVSQTVVDPAHHRFDEGEILREPTCTEPGLVRYTCLVCGTEREEELPKLGHRYINGVCVVCGAGYMDEIVYGDRELYGMYFAVDEVLSSYGAKLINEYGVYLYVNEDAVIDKVAVYLIQDGTMWRRAIACVGSNIRYAVYVPYLSMEQEILYSGLLNPTRINTFALREGADGIWRYNEYATIGANLAKHDGSLILNLSEVAQAGSKTRIFDDLEQMKKWLLGSCDEHHYDAGTVTPPTCTERGYTSYTCAVCHAVYRTEYLPALGHDYRAAVVAPTCTEQGYTTHTCTRCGDSYTDAVVPPLGHTESEWIVKAEPNCLNDGYRYTVCHTCEEILRSEVLPALGHDYAGTTVLPTCTADGYDEHICKRCGDSYTDHIVPALGHVEGDWVYDLEPDCTDGGFGRKYCTRCGELILATSLPPLGHDYIFDYVEEPTCVKPGYTVYTCTRCGETDIRDHTEALGHDYAVQKTVPPTCTESGYDVIACKRCGDSYTDHIVPALGHVEGDWVYDLEPDCTDGGFGRKYCTRCGELILATSLPPLGHDYVFDYVEEPTCVKPGYTVYTCTRCGETDIRDHTEALGHDYAVQKTVPPTCTESGYDVITCKRCRDSYTDHIVPALGHVEGDWVYDLEPDCTDGGFGRKYCTRCGELILATSLPPLGHDYVFDYVEEPTCVKPGYTVYTCTRCSETDIRDHTAALGHDYAVQKTIAPTCAESGYDIIACKRCGDSYTDHVTPPVGHIPGEWEYDLEPDCTDGGFGRRSCIYCGELFEVGYLPPLGHDYANGRCRRCGDADPDYHGYSEGLVYTLNSDKQTYSVTGIGTCTDTKIIIPSTHPEDGKKVTGIGEHAFHGNKKIVAVTIPDSITNIGKEAFQYCSNLTGVFISDLAAWCNIDFNSQSSNPLFNARHLYLNGVRVTEVVFPDGFTEVKPYVFNGEEDLAKVTIPDSVTSIGIGAFCDCSRLTSFIIPDSVTSIRNSAFAGCKSFTSVTIPDSVTSIGQYAFNNCTKLTRVAFANTIGWYTTQDSTATSGTAMDVTNPSTNASNLRNTYVSYYWLCNKPVAVDYSEGLEYTLNSDCESYSVSGIGSCTDTDIVIPPTHPENGKPITRISHGAFSSSFTLTSVTIPESVTCIEVMAFNGCYNLTSVIFANTDGWYTTWSDSDKSGPSMDVTDPATNAANLSTVYSSYRWKVAVDYSEGLEYTLNPDGKTYSVTRIGTCTDTEIIIPSTHPINGKPVTSIGSYAFSDMYAGGFYIHVTIPDSVTSIGHFAFQRSGLTGIIIPDSVISIGDMAFGECSYLTDITIPASVTSIGHGVFQYCGNLTGITVSAENPAYASVDGVLFDKTISTLIQYPAGKSGSSYAIPESVTGIERGAFEGCYKLTGEIIIPASVTSIGREAFWNCSVAKVTFVNPQGWYTLNSIYETSGPAMDVTDPTTNAENLRNTYYTCIWKRN